MQAVLSRGCSGGTTIPMKDCESKVEHPMLRFELTGYRLQGALFLCGGGGGV